MFYCAFMLLACVSMGLQCSKQGQLPQFREKSFKRLAPEGESVTLNPSRTSCFTSDVTRGEVALLLNDLSKLSVSPKTIDNLSKFSMSPKTIDNITAHAINQETPLNGRDCPMATKDLSTEVGLPPEGEVSQKEFVELPSEKEKNKFDDPLNGSVNELLTKPVDESEIVELPIEESLSSPRKRMAHINNTRYIAYKTPRYQKRHTREQANNKNWSYTLYNFEGKGITTKEDLCQLMQSICKAVGKSVCSDTSFSNSPPKSHTLKVHLQIGHEKCSCKCTTKSPSKYTPTSNYKGMVFPPPNSIEAEKVSSYIEEKLSTYKERDEIIKKDLHHERSRSNHKCCYDAFKLPQRQPVFEGNEDRLHSANGRTNLCKHYTKKYADSSPPSPEHVKLKKSSLNSSEERFSDNFLSDDHSNHDSNKFRLKHRCTHHRKMKEKNKQIDSSHCDQESDLCRQIKVNARKTILNHEYDTCSQSSFASSMSNDSETDSCVKLCDTNKVSKSKVRRNTLKSELCFKYRERPSVWPGQANENNNEKISHGNELCICKRMLGQSYPCNHSIKHRHYNSLNDGRT